MRLVAALSLALMIATASAGVTELPRAPGAVYGYRAEQVANGVHAFHQGNNFHLQPRGNVGVIEQSDGLVLVDSGGSPAGAEQVIAHVRGLSKKPVKAIILTHWHGDHVLGVSRLLQEWPKARVIATGPTRDMLANPASDRFMPGSNEAARKTYLANVDEAITYLKSVSVKEGLQDADRAGFAQAAAEHQQFRGEMEQAWRLPPTEIFTGQIDLPDRKRPVRVLFPGKANTAGDAIVWLPKQKIVFTGDLVVAPIPYGFNSYPRDWLAALAQIRALGVKKLVPGHGEPQKGVAYLDRLAQMITRIRAESALIAVAQGEPAKLADKINLDRERDAFVGTDPWLRRWFKNYWAEPAISSAVREARGEDIVQGSD